MTIILAKGRHYLTDKGEEVRFCYFSQTGNAVFSPRDEHSFQDVFIFEDGWEKHIVQNLDGVFEVGDRVEKIGGDYSFEGEVVSVFKKRSGAVRLVVEDDRGLLFIFNETNLKPKNAKSYSDI